MNRGALRTRILTALAESATAPVFFSTTEMNAVIDEGAEVLCEMTGAVKRTAFVPLLPGTTYYSLQAISPRAMAPWRLWLQSQDRRLGAVSIADLDARHETWATVTGDPWHWFPVSWDTFGLFPHPAAGGGVLRIDHLEWPRPLLDDADHPELLEGDHEALTLYGVYYGAAKRWDVPAALNAYALFQQRVLPAADRTGAGRLQARAWQVGQAADLSPQSGVSL